MRQLTVILAFLVVAPVIADDATDKAMKEDRAKIAGTWRGVMIEVNGGRLSDEDARQVMVVNGTDGTWVLHHKGKVISRGTSTFNPTKNPKTVDFTPTEGEGKGNSYLGIYELGESTRKMCFAPAGKKRPEAFTTTSGSEHILVRFEREKKK
ncbi:MAG: TIGR03067 domain-containing protein [Gemmataceae bacterium]|nr:TIGR03067 domain-containing protein [Gemmataceae bacterium]